MRHFRTFPSPGITAEDPPVSRTRRFTHETTLADPFVSRTRRLAHETTSEGPSVSRTRCLAHETTSEDHSVSRTRRLAHETTSEGHSVSRTRRLAHETTSEDPSREQNAPSRSRDNFGRHRQAPSCTNPISWPLWYTRQASPVPILSPGHFGTPDKPFLYQSYLLATLVHQTSPSCTKNSHTVSLGLLFFLKSVLNCLFEG